MSIIYFLIGCSVLLALAFLAAFFWAQRDGQHEDLYTPSIRVLFDETPQAEEKNDPDHK